MSLIDAINQFVVGRITFPAVNYVMNRKDILGRYRQLLLAEYSSKDELRELQFQRLRAVLRRAYKWNPFYTRRFDEIGLVPEDIRTLEDFRSIPPLDREDIMKHRMDLVDVRYHHAISDAERIAHGRSAPISLAGFKARSLVRVSTSGSTGTPTVFYEDGSTTALSWAHELRLKKWFHISPGAKEARMSATSAEFAGMSRLSSARQWLWNQMILPGYFLSDREYEISVKKLRQFRPRVLWGPTHALVGLAQYIQRTNQEISRCRPDLVISRAAPLYSHEERILAEVFACPITNIYGTRELGHVAMNCPHGSIHVNQENYLVEIEDPGLAQGSDGAGKILITPLFESPMPFLRYRIGDIAELGERDCPCGRPQMTLGRIMGRTGELFTTPEGRLLEPNFWCIAFESARLSQDVERFQVIYRRNDCIRFRIVARSSYSDETESELRNFLEQNFQSTIQFEFEYVPEIKPQPSGKFLFVVNEIPQQEEQLMRI